jgi:hypothetical protein
MPKGLSKELKRLAEANHFMDVSEAVRSILRGHFFQHNPGLEDGVIKEGTNGLK